MDIEIIKGVVSKDQVHSQISYSTRLSLSGIVKRLKGRSSQMLLQEFPNLHRRYWGNHFLGKGYGCWSTGNITGEMINSYLEHHKSQPNSDDNFLLE